MIYKKPINSENLGKKYGAIVLMAAGLNGYGLPSDAHAIAVTGGNFFNTVQQISSSKANLDHKFLSLANQWKVATENVSSISIMITHPAYLQIIGMGNSILPLLLKEIDESPVHWFPALKAITGIDPVNPEDAGNIDAMRNAWISWGREEGLY